MTDFHSLDAWELLDIFVRRSSDFAESELAALRQELRTRGYDTDRHYDIRKAYFADRELGYICGACGEKMYVQGEELWLGRIECPWCQKAQDIVMSRLESFDAESEKEKPDQAPTGGPARFPAVKTLSEISRVLAWVISIAAAVLGVVAFLRNDPLAGIGLIILGAVVLLINLAFAEILMVLLAIEENTRTQVKG